MIRLFLIMILVGLSSACTVNFQIECSSAAMQGEGTITEALSASESTKTDADVDADIDANIQPLAGVSGM